MAAIEPTTRYVTALGPVKMEVMEFTGTVNVVGGGTQTGVDNADTVDTLIQGPKFALVVADSDASDTAWATSISGKTITLTNTGASGVNIRILAFGT
jgi:hypothetical protein